MCPEQAGRQDGAAGTSAPWSLRGRQWAVEHSSGHLIGYLRAHIRALLGGCAWGAIAKGLLSHIHLILLPLPGAKTFLGSGVRTPNNHGGSRLGHNL